MRLLTLSPRGTDLILAALKLDRVFTREELNESYGELRLRRDGTLPPEWKQGLSNQIQRLSSDFSIYHKEQRQLDLLRHCGKGRYAIRSLTRAKLLTAANERSDLLTSHNVLVAPVTPRVVLNVVESPTSNNAIVGRYAQQKCMREIKARGFEIIEDSANRWSYDFLFRGSRRPDVPQIMECKGTRRSEIDIRLTENELAVCTQNHSSYWLGLVTNINVTDGIASGGSDPFVVPPPILDAYRFASGVRLDRRL